MPKRIANHTIMVVRDGKRVKVKPGTLFDFTADEMTDLKNLGKNSVRAPVDESAQASGGVPAAKVGAKAPANNGGGGPADSGAGDGSSEI